MEKMANLPPEGLLLYEEVKKWANVVKEENLLFLIKAKEKLNVQNEKYQNFITTQSKNLDFLLDRCSKSDDDSNLIRLMTDINVYKAEITKWRNSMEEFSTNPPGREKLQQYIDNFNFSFAKLKEYASSINFIIPWQVEYMAVANTSDPNATVNFEGGKITDSNGRSIWSAICSVCNVEIQDGARGQGVERYHCLDCEKVDQCVSCHTRMSSLKNILKNKHELFVELQKINLHLDHRLPITSAKSLSEALMKSLETYSNRPCYKQNDTWITYQEINDMTYRLCNSIKSFIPKGDFVAIASENHLEWVISDFTSCLNGYISVGLHTKWPMEEITKIIEECEIKYVFCSLEQYEKLKSFDICTFIVFDVLENTSENVFSFHDLIEKGQLVRPDPLEDYDEIYSLVYSSGTTGDPKGIISTRKDWRNGNLATPNFMEPLVIFSYSSMAHGMDRGMIWQTISNGGRIALSSEEMILQDAKTILPTLFIAMPHLWNKLYLKSQSSEEIVSNPLGDRILVVATGGSVISSDVFNWMKHTFGKCAVLNAYGLTECPGISTNGVLGLNVELKLEDCPDLGYSNKDKPYPRGEICVKGPNVTRGYFKREKDTKELFDSQGFLKTGDIGQLVDGNLEIIDRTKNLVELYVDGRSHWVSVTKLENLYGSIASIQQIYITGDRMSPHLVAIVVASGQETEFEILSQWKDIQHRQRLIHVPTAVYIEKEPWTEENGGLSSTNKLKRGHLRKKYQNQIDLMLQKV